MSNNVQAGVDGRVHGHKMGDHSPGEVARIARIRPEDANRLPRADGLFSGFFSFLVFARGLFLRVILRMRPQRHRDWRVGQHLRIARQFFRVLIQIVILQLSTLAALQSVDHGGGAIADAQPHRSKILIVGSPLPKP